MIIANGLSLCYKHGDTFIQWCIEKAAARIFAVMKEYLEDLQHGN
jgi:hypothetical protein